MATSSDQEGLNKARRSAALGNAMEIARRPVPRDQKQGLIKTLEQAGLDYRGEVHAPCASEGGANPGRIAEGLGGNDGLVQAPAQTRNHNPHCSGEGKEWLDRKSAKQEGIGAVMKWFDPILQMWKKDRYTALEKKRCLDALALDIITYLDKLAERGSLLNVGALDADPKYKWIWGQCASLWRNHRVKTGIGEASARHGAS